MRSRFALVLGLALALGHALAPVSALASSSWADGAPHGDFYSQSQDSYETSNIIACEDLAKNTAQARGLQVSTKIDQHKYPNGHICSKVVVVYSNGEKFDCYSANNIVRK